MPGSVSGLRRAAQQEVITPLAPDAIATAADIITTVYETFCQIESGDSALARNLRATISQFERDENGTITLRLDVRNANGESCPAHNRRLRRELIERVRGKAQDRQVRVGFDSGNRPLIKQVRTPNPFCWIPRSI